MTGAADTQLRLEEETLRLLGARAYPAVVISAVTHLDALHRSALENDEQLPGRAYALDPLADLAAGSKLQAQSDHLRICGGYECGPW